MVSRAWVMASGIAAVSALVVGALMLAGEVTRPTGVLVIAIGLMPVAMALASTPGGRRKVGALHIAAGLLLGVTGLVLASRHDFLQLKLASISWRILVTSGHGLAPIGWMSIGLALALTGTGILLLLRSFAVLSALLTSVTCGYFAGSLAIAPYVRSTARAGLGRDAMMPFDPQAVGVALVLALVALLLAIAALRQFPVSWTPPVPDRARGARPMDLDAPGHDRGRGKITEKRLRLRWVTVVLWSTIGVGAVSTIAVWVWPEGMAQTSLAEVFPDPNLRTCVAEAMGSPATSTTASQHELSAVLSLTCNTAVIANISGLDALTNLASLSLTNNSVTDLTPLADLQKLATIKLTNNKVTNLTPLAGLPLLRNLGLSGNIVGDLTPLAQVKTLTSIGLSHNRISDLGPLAALTGLNTLEMNDNRVTDLTPLAHLPQLARVTLAGNRIVTPEPLSRLPALARLDIARNRITDATTFAGFATLEELWVGGNLLTDVTALADLPSLTGVDLEGADLGTKGLGALRARNIYVGLT